MKNYPIKGLTHDEASDCIKNIHEAFICIDKTLNIINDNNMDLHDALFRTCHLLITLELSIYDEYINPYKPVENNQ